MLRTNILWFYLASAGIDMQTYQQVSDRSGPVIKMKNSQSYSSNRPLALHIYVAGKFAVNFLLGCPTENSGAILILMASCPC